MARRAGAARERRHWRFRPAAAWLLLGCAAPTAARRPEPLAHASALRLLKQLSSEGCRESVSIDIGGTLAKLVLFQPRAAASAPSEPPIFDTYRELSIYVPALGAPPRPTSPPPPSRWPSMPVLPSADCRHPLPPQTPRRRPSLLNV